MRTKARNPRPSPTAPGSPPARQGRTRWAGAVALGASLALVTTACGTGTNAGSGSGADAGTASVVSSALDDLRDPSFPEPLIEVDDLLAGGPPPDGIPALDDPAFETTQETSWLEADDPVLSLTVAGETRAYPLGIITWHEIVNDTVGGVPVAVTYCPLCNSGVAFERTVEGEATTFGVSGLLYADNLVMYDRATESLWPQLTGTASVGTRTGTKLKAIPMGVVGWSQFTAEHPGALVLSRDTGHDRSYGSNPYVGYDDPSSDPIFPLPDGPDDRMLPKERVIGLGQGAGAVAVRRSEVARAGVVDLVVDGAPVTVWHLPGQRSALGGQEIAEAEEIGTVAVLDPRLDGEVLDFTAEAGGTVTDVGTGSEWNAFGRAVSGPLRGQRLTPVIHLDTFWFAWVAFQPETVVATVDGD